MKEKLFNIIKENDEKFSLGRGVVVDYFSIYEKDNIYGSYKRLKISDLINRSYVISEYTNGMGILFLDMMFDPKNRIYVKADVNYLLERYKKAYFYHPSEQIVLTGS